MSVAKIIVVGLLVAFGAVTATSTQGFAQSGVRIEGQVQAGGGPLANSAVTLWAASAGEPKPLAQARSGGDGLGVAEKAPVWGAARTGRQAFVRQ